jgi:ribosome biogenesis GTPase
MVRYGADERLVSLSQSCPGLILARVTAQHRSRYAVMTDSGPFAAEVSGKLMHLAASGEEYPAVGDFVLIRAPDADGPAVIAQTLPRKSAFVRKAAGNAHETQVVAANIDVAFLCMSLNENYNESRLERYLAVAWESGAKPVVLLTKADLCPDPRAALARVAALAAGAEALALSVREEGAKSELLSRVPAASPPRSWVLRAWASRPSST